MNDQEETENQKSLHTFGGGSKPNRNDREKDHDTRTDRAKHRRKLYSEGGCRAISTSKGCRCGGGVVEDGLCNYHENDLQPVLIDDGPGLLARWCGTKGTEWEQIPKPCREALLEVDPDADEYR